MNRTTPLKLGWLFPYSGIFRSLKKDLLQGLDTALQREGMAAAVDIYPEFIQSGGFKETEAALKKLLLYEEVDLVIGVMSTKVALPLIPLLESRQTPLVLLNLGADIPTRQLSSDYLFYNSLHLWKSEWVMGKWAQQKYGGAPSIYMSLYEGGYGLHESFRAGASVSGAATVQLTIARDHLSPPATGSFLSYIRDQGPRHVHALLSGKEGQHFLQSFRDQGFAQPPGLTVNPFMTEEGLPTEMPPGLELYNAMTWSRDLDSAGNHSFVHSYTNRYVEAPHAFGLLAYEAGLALAAAIRDNSGPPTRDKITEALSRVRPVGPRGEIGLSTRPLQTNLPVYIRQARRCFLTGRPTNEILERETGIEWNDSSLPTEPAHLSGWQNPYLCV